MAYNDLEFNMKREAFAVYTNQVGLLAQNFWHRPTNTQQVIPDDYVKAK